MSKPASLTEIVGRLVTDPSFEKDFNFDDFFLRNKDFLLGGGKRDTFASIDLVNIMTHTNLYLRLNLAMLMATKPDNPDEFNAVFRATKQVFELDFLNKHGKNH
eukprot:CAMPEP_0170461394 /NCGR_PEP_ID=MMETSP0123-20130129/7320_1 /TAXON_ID=182087 /ORGANISM="Favella ehrenbergii, Strain Fehren 1" /LENGTH=103 /DNA_ID=CAMNT_0010726411 /DNA_START=26 /DNA_END=337 /DNA_ORIENTATION=+